MKKIKIVTLFLFSIYLVQIGNVQTKAESTTVMYVYDIVNDTSVVYQLDVYVTGRGELRYQSSGKENVIRDAREGLLIGEDETITFEIIPDDDVQIQQILLNGKDITSTLTRNQITITGSEGNQILVVSFENTTPNTGVEINTTIHQILIILSLFILLILQRRKERLKVYDGLNEVKEYGKDEEER